MFFPKGQRTDLITVPSCEAHNIDNSKDVEYARNFIVMGGSVNETGKKVFRTKGKRSFTRSPKLLMRTLSGARPFEGRILGVKTDKGRYHAIMKSIACALYFHEFGSRFVGDWAILSEALSLDRRELTSEYIDIYQFDHFIKDVLREKPFTPGKSGNPHVFKYSYYKRQDGEGIFKLVLYEDFVVYLKTGSNPLDFLDTDDLIRMIKQQD